MDKSAWVKVFDIGKGVIEMEVSKAGCCMPLRCKVKDAWGRGPQNGASMCRPCQVNQELGEIGGVFVSKQPSDTDMGAKAPGCLLQRHTGRMPSFDHGDALAMRVHIRRPLAQFS